MATVKRAGFEELRSEYKVILHRSFLQSDNKELLTVFCDSPGFDNDKKASMDQVFRDTLLELLKMEQDVLEKYISFCIDCCRNHMVTPTMPVVLLGDVFDAFTLDKCEKMFAYVEQGVSTWKEELFFIACKNNLLRMCNDLLRRLSRSQNTIFCGRILLFLAKFFPFSERSGLNIVSEFNLDNITELGGDNTVNLKDSLTEEEYPNETNKNKLLIDYNLYCKFWALQEFFRNPNLCYDKIQWKTFSSHSTSVLSAFASYKLEAMQVKDSRAVKRTAQAMEDDSHEETESHYFAKFLTNQKLLELQLSDSNFRRCVLVQFLILFQYLNSSVKFRMETYELKTDQSDYVKETTDRVYKLLSETPPDGKTFASCVNHILKREEHWNNWKNEGCPEFQKLKSTAPVDLSSNDDSKKMLKPRRKKLLGDIVKDYESQGKFYLGNNELTKLWNLCPNNLEVCKGKERNFLPSLESYLSEAIDQAEHGVKGEGRVVADGSFGWRALRLLARRSPHFFTHSNNPINRLPDYLDIMIRKIAKDLPSSDAKRIKQELEEEVSEEQMEADLMKGGDPNDVEQVQDAVLRASDDNDCEGDIKVSAAPTKNLPDNLMDELCEKLGSNWKKLALKLGFQCDDILYMETSKDSDPVRSREMLQIWFDNDEDASVENLAYVMEGLNLLEACAVLKEMFLV